jgi:hypothetical protein
MCSFEGAQGKLDYVCVDIGVKVEGQRGVWTRADGLSPEARTLHATILSMTTTAPQEPIIPLLFRTTGNENAAKAAARQCLAERLCLMTRPSILFQVDL